MTQATDADRDRPHRALTHASAGAGDGYGRSGSIDLRRSRPQRDGGFRPCASHILDVYVFDYRFNIINADDEANVPTWAASSVTFVAGAATLVLAIASSGRTHLQYGALTAILLFFSLDDSVGLHELIVHGRLDSIGPIDHPTRIVWPIVYLPMLVAGLTLLVMATRRTFAPARAAVLVGLGMLVAAVAAEIGAALILQAGADERSLLYTLEVMVEEGFELGGWMLIAVGLLAASIARSVDVSLGCV